MQPDVLDIRDFIVNHRRNGLPVLDGRSEGEFAHASFPGSRNIPLLNNEHRRLVGIVYKQQGRDAAVLEGLKLVGPVFHEILAACQLEFPERQVLLYCWRGGMRSSILAWIMQTGGFRVSVLRGGYKAFRNWTAETIRRPLPVIVLGGPTGSGKTDVLRALAVAGEQVLDLEKLANHKGSAFGGLGMDPQPSNEAFENQIALAWDAFDASRPVWIENESRSIGSCILPEPLYNLIRTAPVVEMQVPEAERMERITREYGSFSIEQLIAATGKLKKRMGPQHVKQASEHLQSGDFDGWLRPVLDYYDRLYNYGSSLRHPVTRFDFMPLSSTAEERAREIICFANGLTNSKETHAAVREANQHTSKAGM